MIYKFQNAAATSLRARQRLYSTTSLIIKEQLPVVAYQPEHVEKDKYDRWEQYGHFKPETNSDKPVFSMVLPPPNVTGKLHLGHALGCTVQDVILRRKRQMGHNVLWVPGTDHAGIATQGVVEKYLYNTKHMNRHHLGRERFNSEVWRWKQKHGDEILKQLKTLGCSLDWSRQMFTMDVRHNAAVRHAFIELYNKGLIYRKKGLVNWCNALKSTVSDIEVDQREIKTPTEIRVPGCMEPVKLGQMYSFAYKIFGTNKELIVSTTMPETMLGDVAVAVNPRDERYKNLIGKRVFHPFRNCTIPIILDEFVKMDFGSGAVKITPAHSMVDYDIAQNHKLPMIQVIDENGEMINAQEFTGLKRYECRKLLVEKLNKIGFLRSIVPHEMTLPVCSRTGDIIDHLPKEQWFLSCREMNERAKEAVRSGKLKIEPEKYLRNWLDWTENDRDWCISRQLWWGHEIPTYKCYVDHESVWCAARNERQAMEQAAVYFGVFPEKVDVQKDRDVLDTWFSSAIYPFAALGWPEKTADLEQFYPLSLMATGHDILGFWVHKMVMLGLELTNKLPFHHVLLHGVICDNKGKKMSKSKGNVIDPIDVIQGISMERLKAKTEQAYKNGVLNKSEYEKALAYHRANFSHTCGIPECGVDALRFTLLSQDIKSHFVNFDVSMCHANKLFCNKIWQSVKYVQLSSGKLQPLQEEITEKDLTYFDRWILSRMAEMVQLVNVHLDDYNFHLATKAIRNHIYNEFCDVYLEATKTGFTDRNPKTGYAHAHTLSVVLNTALRCLNPFMIYLTQEVIPKIPYFEKNVVYNYNDLTNRFFDFPQFKDFAPLRNPELEERAGKILDAASLIRELKGLCGMSNRLRPAICVKTKNEYLKSDMVTNRNIILNLARCCAMNFQDEGQKNYIKAVLDTDCEVWVEILGDDVESTVSAAKMRIQRKMQKLEKKVSELESRYSSEQSVNSIPEWSKNSLKETLTSKREELLRMQQDLARLTQNLSSLKS